MIGACFKYTAALAATKIPHPSKLLWFPGGWKQ